MKQELDQKLANLHTKLSNIVLDEMDKQLDKIKLFDDSPQPNTETQKTSRSRQTEKILNDSQKDNIAQIAQPMVQNLTGQPLSYKRSANLKVAKQQELRYISPASMQISRYTGDRQNIDYPAVQRQQMWTNTASDSIPQHKHNRGQYCNRNIVQTPTQQPFLSPAKSQSKLYVIENTCAEKPESSQLDFIQEHWLFQTQLHLLGELNEHINYVGKGVDKYDPILPICMPQGYGGVAILWKKDIDNMIKPMDLGSERIQCVEIKESCNSNILLTAVYLPAKESKNHLAEYQEAIDQLYELHQKYDETHKSIKGGDINDDLNEPRSTKRNLYMRDFINECCLKYDNMAKTFVNSLGQESLEIDYFLHNLSDGELQRKQVLHDMPENTSNHHPIRMSIKFKHKNAEVNRKQNNSRIAKKVNWDKVDTEWYSAHIRTHIDRLQVNENMEETAIEQAILKLRELLRETATLT
jgi:hypothetical protein